MYKKSNVPDSTKNGQIFFFRRFVGFGGVFRKVMFLIAPKMAKIFFFEGLFLVLSKPTMGKFLALRFPVQPAAGREHPPCFRAILCSRPPEKLSPHCVPQRRRDLDRSGLDIFFSGKTFGAIKTPHRENIWCYQNLPWGNFLALRFPVQPAAGREHPPCFRAILCSRPPEKLSPHCVPQRRRDLDRSGLDIFFSGKTFGAIKTPHRENIWCYQNLPRGIFWRFAFRCSRHPAESIRLAFERSCAAGRQRSYRRIACRKDGVTSTGRVWTSFFQEKHLVLSKPLIGKTFGAIKTPHRENIWCYQNLPWEKKIWCYQKPPRRKSRDILLGNLPKPVVGFGGVFRKVMFLIAPKMATFFSKVCGF